MWGNSRSIGITSNSFCESRTNTLAWLQGLTSLQSRSQHDHILIRLNWRNIHFHTHQGSWQKFISLPHCSSWQWTLGSAKWSLCLVSIDHSQLLHTWTWNIETKTSSVIVTLFALGRSPGSTRLKPYQGDFLDQLLIHILGSHIHHRCDEVKFCHFSALL